MHMSRVPLSSACTWDGFGPRQEPLNSSGACESASATCELIDTRRPMACLTQYVRSFPAFFLSENSAALPISHSRGVYALRIRITHHSAAPALGNTTDHTSRIRVLSNSIKRRKPAGEGYVLRTTYPYYISSAESPRERAIYYALHIRIIYQALKAHPRELSVPRITYPYYVSSAESPPERAMEYALRIRIIYQAPNHNTRRTQHT